MELPILYKRGRTSILAWNISVDTQYNEDKKTIATITILQGQLNGKYQKYIEKIDKGKNIGKLNETTPYTQACNEAKSKWKNKKDEGYKSLVDLDIPYKYDKLQLYNTLDKYLPTFNTDAKGQIKPMLAKPYEIGKINFPCYGQPKLNGVRCIAFLIKDNSDNLFKNTFKVKLLSREGKEYIVNHIQNELLEIFKHIESDIVFDGELYCHGMPLNQIVSAVKKPNPNTVKIEYHIYDLATEDIPQQFRLEDLDNIKSLFKSYIKAVPTITITDELDVSFNHKEYTTMGYEGLMLRKPEANYGFGSRSKDLLKVKTFIEEEFEIIDFVLGKRGVQDLIFICKTKDDKEFNCVVTGTIQEKKDTLNNIHNIIGKKATVKFFEYTEFGIPFHGNVTCIRDYE